VFTSGTYGRHGWLRRLGHGGKPVGTLTFATTGRIRLEGVLGEYPIDSVAVPDVGSVSLKDHTGWVPFGAAIVSLIRDPAR
jgi:hypothetical protein